MLQFTEAMETELLGTAEQQCKPNSIKLRSQTDGRMDMAKLIGTIISVRNGSKSMKHASHSHPNSGEGQAETCMNDSVGLYFLCHVTDTCCQRYTYEQQALLHTFVSARN
jgi:hypothetical protein